MTIKNEPPNEKESIRERLAQHFGDDLLFADNFDAAIIGVSMCLRRRKYTNLC